MGRTAQPTALKLVKGERKDRVNTSEPIPRDGELTPPAWLARDAVAVWGEYAPDLAAKRVLTTWDLEAFAGWCDAVARRADAARHLDSEGTLVERDVFNRNGEVTGQRVLKSEWFAVWKDANEVIARVGARFGLTPAERAQLKIGGSEVGNPKERYRSSP